MIKLALINININQDPSPPTGLASIATYIEKNINSVEITVIDSNFEDVFKNINEIKPDVIGLSAMTVEYSKAIEIGKKIKKINNAPIIIGGVHISTLPVSLEKIFDLGIIGEGEETMLELVKLYEKKHMFNIEDLEKIKGIVYYAKGKIKTTEARPLIKDLDCIPFPDKKYIHKNYFKKRINFDKKLVTYPIMTSRGCPYRCLFCSTSRFWKTIRFNSAGHVVAEIKDLIKNYKVERITIWDDLFTIKKDRIEKITELLKKEKLLGKVTFECMARVNTITDDICIALKKMGVVFLNFGFESGNKRVLKMLKQNVSIEQNKEAILLGKKYGFMVFGSLIFGSPTETLEEMDDTIKFIDFAVKNRIDGLWTFVMTPFPGTPIWDIAKERGKVSEHMNWKLLSHQSIKNPLLLDKNIKLNDFKERIFSARRKLNPLRVKQAVKYILADPFNLVKEIVCRPKVILKSLVQIVIHKNKYNN